MGLLCFVFKEIKSNLMYLIFHWITVTNSDFARSVETQVSELNSQLLCSRVSAYSSTRFLSLCLRLLHLPSRFAYCSELAPKRRKLVHTIIPANALILFRSKARRFLLPPFLAFPSSSSFSTKIQQISSLFSFSLQSSTNTFLLLLPLLYFLFLSLPFLLSQIPYNAFFLRSSQWTRSQIARAHRGHRVNHRFAQSRRTCKDSAACTSLHPAKPLKLLPNLTTLHV